MEIAIQHLKQADPKLAAIIERVGPCEMSWRPAEFEALARAIVYQQLNGKAARTIYERVEAKAGSPLTPEGIGRLRMPTLRACGLSQAKASYIRDLAKSTTSGKLDFAALPAMSDEDVIAALTQVKGIGEWSAHMFLMFALRRPDVLPVGDFGIRVAMQKAYRLREMPKPKRMEQIAKPWRPYRSVASW